MNRRNQALEAIAYAGYHGDRAAFTRIYIEHRLSLEAARMAYERGEMQLLSGAKCGCVVCTAKQADLLAGTAHADTRSDAKRAVDLEQQRRAEARAAQPGSLADLPMFDPENAYATQCNLFTGGDQ